MYGIAQKLHTSVESCHISLYPPCKRPHVAAHCDCAGADAAAAGAGDPRVSARPRSPERRPVAAPGRRALRAAGQAHNGREPLQTGAVSLCRVIWQFQPFFCVLYVLLIIQAL